MDGVLADHSGDIVMFDVPPPSVGVRGIDAYRGTWPPFFEWQKAGATFDIESMEVTTGEDVAFAHAVLRCGTEEEFRQDPEPPSIDGGTAQARRPLGRDPRASLVPAQDLVVTTGRRIVLSHRFGGATVCPVNARRGSCQHGVT